MVEGQISLAGTNPEAVCRARKLPGYERHEREQLFAELDRRIDEKKRQDAAWPRPRYISVFDPDARRDFLASSGIAPDPIPISSEDEIPAEYRCGGKPDGEPLDVAFVSRPEQYNLSGPYLSKYYKGPRLRLGRKNIFRHEEIAALSDKKNRRESD